MKTVRLLLNSGFAGPHAGFMLAQERGYYARAGLRIAWGEGNGAAAVLPALFDGSWDAVYGDLSCLIPIVASLPQDTGPVAAFVAFSRTPLTIAVRADGPVRQPGDLACRVLSGHRDDAAMVCFPAYARAARLDISTVEIITSGESLAAQVERMIETDAHQGVFGFVNTIIASLAEAGKSELGGKIRFFEYADLLPDFYGNALIVRRDFLKADPLAVTALATATRQGFVEAMADPVAGLEAVRLTKSTINMSAQLQRWKGTIAKEMGHAEMAEIGVGRAMPGRIDRSCQIMATALNLPRCPAAAELLADDATGARAAA